MIHTAPEVIKPGTLALLRKLQADDQLKNHFLVGGTALALLFGHRHSVDLDLFCREEFDENAIEDYLQEKYNYVSSVKFRNTLMGFIDGIKVDLITHKAPLFEDLLLEGSIRLASPLDISAMKLNAIAQSGQRQKDFYDLYLLFEHYSLAQMLEAYEFKYPNSSVMIPIRAITYFDDIDFESEPPELIRQFSFKDVTARLEAAVKNADKIF